MIATTVHVWVKPDKIADFIAATKKNHEGSVQESGNLRFDIIQNRDNPEKFVLYEAYESEEAAAEHKKTAHYLTWRDTVADWMAQPREGVLHDIICPQDKAQW